MFLKEKILLALAGSISSLLVNRKPRYFSLGYIYFLIDSRQDSIRGLFSDFVYQDLVEKIIKDNKPFYRLSQKGLSYLKAKIPPNFFTINSPSKQKHICLVIISEKDKIKRQFIKNFLTSQNYGKITSSAFLSFSEPPQTIKDKDLSSSFTIFKIILTEKTEEMLKKCWTQSNFYQDYQKAKILVDEIEKASLRSKENKKTNLKNFFFAQSYFYKGLKKDPCLPSSLSTSKITSWNLSDDLENIYRKIFPRKLDFITISHILEK